MPPVQLLKLSIEIKLYRGTVSELRRNIPIFLVMMACDELFLVDLFELG